MSTSLERVLNGTTIATHQRNNAEAAELRNLRRLEAELSATLEGGQAPPRPERWYLTDLAAAIGGILVALAGDLGSERDSVALGLAVASAGAVLVLSTPVVSSYTRRARAPSIAVRVVLVLLTGASIYGLAYALGALLPVVPAALAVVMGAAVLVPRLRLARALFCHEDDVRALHAVRRAIAVLGGTAVEASTASAPMPARAKHSSAENVHGPN